MVCLSERHHGDQRPSLLMEQSLFNDSYLEHVELVILVTLEALGHGGHSPRGLVPEVKQRRLVVREYMGEHVTS